MTTGWGKRFIRFGAVGSKKGKMVKRERTGLQGSSRPGVCEPKCEGGVKKMKRRRGGGGCGVGFQGVKTLFTLKKKMEGCKFHQNARGRQAAKKKKRKPKLAIISGGNFLRISNPGMMKKYPMGGKFREKKSCKEGEWTLAGANGSWRGGSRG